MGFKRFAFKFGVELNCNKPGMVGNLNDFNQTTIGAGSSEPQSIRFKLLPVLIVELVSVAMTLIDIFSVISFAGDAVEIQHGRLGTQSHRATHLRDILLFVKQANHRMSCVLVKFT